MTTLTATVGGEGAVARRRGRFFGRGARSRSGLGEEAGAEVDGAGAPLPPPPLLPPPPPPPRLRAPPRPRRGAGARSMRARGSALVTWDALRWGGWEVWRGTMMGKKRSKGAMT